MENHIITLSGITYTLQFDEFEEGIDLEALLKIDYTNLQGEMLTFPIVVAKLGILLADAESQASEKKLAMDVQEAKLKEKYRIELAEQNNGKNPTIDALNSAVLVDKTYIAFKRATITAQKTRDYIFSIYLAAKDKSEKINKIYQSADVQQLPDSVLESRLNNTVVRKRGTSKRLIE